MRRLPTALALVLAFSGCIGLPDNGPVEVTSDSNEEQVEGFPYQPPPPQEGMTPEQVVSGFLDAMTAVPVDMSVARRYLTTDSRETWRPEKQTIVYGDATSPQGTSSIRTTLRNADSINARGRWEGRLPLGERRLKLSMVYQDDSWRIDSPPNAMIVPDTWFASNYRQVTLYYFDPTARVLVPEPTYVRSGDRLATALVRGLLGGTASRLSSVSRTFLPDGVTADLSVPVSSDGVAEVRLHGDAASLGSESTRLLAVQLAWTLRQDPSVRRIRIVLGRTTLPVSGHGKTFPVSMGQEFDPVGLDVDQPMYGLETDRLARIDGSFVSAVVGPLGREGSVDGPTSVSVDGTKAATVTDQGSEILISPLVSGGNVRSLIRGERLLPPAWDVLGRAWVLDRTSTGARLRVVVGRTVRNVGVPGITGNPNIRDFLVSRDGSRLLALERRKGSDIVVQARLDTERMRGVDVRTVLQGRGENLDLNDISWRAPTEFVVANRITRTLTELRTVSVDGSPQLQITEPGTLLVRGTRIRVVSSPQTSDPIWLERPRGRLQELKDDATADSGNDAPAGVRLLRYPG